MTSEILADYLELWGVEDDFVVFADGSLGFGLSLSTLDISCWDEERVNGLATSIGRFLNGLPEEIDIQFVQEIKAEQGNLLEGHRALAQSDAPIARELTDIRVDRFKHLLDIGSLPSYKVKLFVRRPFSTPLLQSPRFWTTTPHLEVLSEEKLKSEIKAASQLRLQITQSLTQLGIEGGVIDADEILSLVYRQWNPTRDISRPGYDPSDVRSSLLFTDVSLSEREFSVSDTYHRVLSLKLLPDSTNAAMASCLGELPFDSKLFVSIRIPKQQKELEKLKSQRRIAFSMSRKRGDAVSDVESESKYHDLEMLINEIVGDGEKVFKVAVNVVLTGKSKEDLDQRSAEALAKFRELGGAEAMEETVAGFDIFSDICFPNGRAKERTKHLKSSNLADMIPLYGPWGGHSTPRTLLRSRYGTLVAFDPFTSELSNFNQIISGGSGSGKSFLTNILLLQMLKENPRIFLIDIGGSYKKLCEHLGGQYISFGLSSSVKMNPFDLSEGDKAPTNDKIKFLLSLVELMTKEEDASRLPKLERAEIEEAIQKTYSQSEPRLSKLRQILLDHPNVEMRRFGRILTPWCGGSPFGQFIDTQSTVELNKPLVVFDLKGLESLPDLQAALLFIVTDFVWREVQRDRFRMKFLVLDECWKLFEGASSFIEEVFRTFRKYFASVIAISQNIDDFAQSKIAAAILSNSATKWILMQKGADQERLQQVLHLNANEMALIGSLRQDRGIYSEAFLLTGDNRSVVAIESTPLEYWLATTDPRDLAAIDKRTRELPEKDQQEVLRDLAAQFPQGMGGMQ